MTFVPSFCKKGHCIHILWCIFMRLGHNDPWVESHMWPQQMWGQRSSRGQWPLLQVFCKNNHCTHILWCIFMGLGHNDPWVESHITPQQMWGQRSSRGQWPLVQVFAKRVTVSTYFDVCSGETCGSRTTCLHVYWCLFIKCRDANPPYFRGRLAIFVNILVHFDTQIWQASYFWQVLCHWSYCNLKPPLFWMFMLASL